MGKITDYLTGRDLVEPNGESRTITPGTTSEGLLPVGRTALPPVSETTALRIADVFAAVRVLADSLASLPPRVYRETPSGRVPAGEDQRLVAAAPSPRARLDVGRSALDADGPLARARRRLRRQVPQRGHRSPSSACLDPQTVTVERRGGRVVYKVSRLEGFSEHGPEDLAPHQRDVAPMGCAAFRRCAPPRKVLGLNQGLIEYACNFLGNASRPGGVLSVGEAAVAPGSRGGAEGGLAGAVLRPGRRRRRGARSPSSPASMSFERVEPPMKDRSSSPSASSPPGRSPGSSTCRPGRSAQLAATASPTRTWRCRTATWSITRCGPGSSRIEHAFTNDTDLCPGSVYMTLDTDALLRADPEARAAYYKAALDGGWLTVDEIREREDLPPLEREAPMRARTAAAPPPARSRSAPPPSRSPTSASAA